VGKAHPAKFLRERFATAIKLRRAWMFISLGVLPWWFRSRAAQALAPRVGYFDLEFIWNLVLVIWIFTIRATLT
jgi:hypothetical protein